jgi:hypothetical protein
MNSCFGMVAPQCLKGIIPDGRQICEPSLREASASAEYWKRNKRQSATSVFLSRSLFLWFELGGNESNLTDHNYPRQLYGSKLAKSLDLTLRKCCGIRDFAERLFVSCHIRLLAGVCNSSPRRRRQQALWSLHERRPLLPYFLLSRAWICSP